jgi:hypothetical protein
MTHSRIICPACHEPMEVTRGSAVHVTLTQERLDDAPQRPKADVLVCSRKCANQMRGALSDAKA